jgi:predicted Rossmann-fold nucleotide-binding protein
MKITKKFTSLFKTKQIDPAEALNPRGEVQKPFITHISIFGYANCPPESDLFKSVVEVTHGLAEAGYVVVDGGGPGVMRAATIGAKKAAGKVIGVTYWDNSLSKRYDSF